MNEKINPYVSIIIVAYNYEEYLPRALHFCKHQTYKNYEMVLVNNGSTDSTGEIIEKFKNDNPQLEITIVTIDKNEGLAKGRNAGIIAAKGEYIIFNDADDWMDENCLQILVDESDNGKYDRVIGQYRDVSPNGKVLQIRNYHNNIPKWYITMIQASLFRRTIFVDNKIKVPKVFYDDYYISTIFNSYISNYKIVQKDIYNYFINEYSTSGAKSFSDFEKIVKMFYEFIDINNSVEDRIDYDDRICLNYQMIKMYYFELLHYNRNRSFKELKTIHKKLYKIIKSELPDFYDCAKVTFFKDNGDRFYGRAITFMLCKADKYKFINILLWIYNFISKFYFFKV